MSTGTSSSPRLVRALGPWMAMAVVVGTIIGSGIFKKPQQVAEQVPFFYLAALAWVLGGVLALLGSLALAEVAVLYPRAGGNYVYLREAFGRLAAFLWGWVEFWIIRGASIAALATVFSESMHDILRNSGFRQLMNLQPVAEVLGFWQLRLLTVGVIVALALVNVRGVKWGGLVQLLITIVKVGSLLAIMVLPFVAAYLAPAGNEPRPPRIENLQPFLPDSWSTSLVTGFGAALLGVMWAYHGWMNIAPLAEEVQQPNRNLPLAFLGGTFIIIVLYLGTNLAYSLILPAGEMSQLKDTTVATAFSQRLLGPLGAVVASAAAMCSVFGALNGNLLVGPRVLYAMGEDALAPRALGAIHAQYRTPALAILVMAGWASLLVVGAGALMRYPLPVWNAGSLTINLNVPPDKSIFDILTAFAMFGATTFETLAVATIFIFRFRNPDAERPYRCPGYPWVPLVYVAILVFVVINMFWTQWTEALVGMGFIALGAGVYYFWINRPAPPTSLLLETASPDSPAPDTHIPNDAEVSASSITDRSS